jgi:hypothetical protein
MPNKKKLRLVRMSDNECLQARELNGGALKKKATNLHLRKHLHQLGRWHASQSLANAIERRCAWRHGFP